MASSGSGSRGSGRAHDVILSEYLACLPVTELMNHLRLHHQSEYAHVGVTLELHGREQRHAQDRARLQAVGFQLQAANGAVDGLRAEVAREREMRAAAAAEAEAWRRRAGVAEAEVEASRRRAVEAEAVAEALRDEIREREMSAAAAEVEARRAIADAEEWCRRAGEAESAMSRLRAEMRRAAVEAEARIEAGRFREVEALATVEALSTSIRMRRQSAAVAAENARCAAAEAEARFRAETQEWRQRAVYAEEAATALRAEIGSLRSGRND